MLQGYESAVLNNRGVRSVTVFCESEVGRCLGVVIRSPTVQSWQDPGWWTHVPSLQVTAGPGGHERGFVVVTTDATLCPACSSTTREGYLSYLSEIACTLQPVNPRSTNRLNLRNELDSLGIRDSPERTAHHLPYPLKRTRPTTLVVAVTFGVVDTGSTSSGCPGPTIDGEE
jgi:hypothetical protein